MTILVQERALEDAAAGLARALSWFDSLLAAKVAAHRARLRDGDDFRGIFISEDEVDEILSRASLGDGSSGLNESFEERLSPPLPDRLARLASEFGLNEFDVACLLMVVAYQLDRRYGRLFAYLQDDLTRQTPTAGLALELFCGSFQESAAARSRFAAAAPAVALGLLRVDTAAGQPLMSRVLTPDERVVAFLLGVDDTDEELLGCGASLLPRPAPGLVVGARFHEETERLITRLRATETAPVLAIRGDKGSGRRLAARRIAAALGHDTLLLPWAADGDVSTAMREAVFQDAMLCWADADALLDAERPPRALELALEASQRVVIFTLGHVGHLPLRLAGRPVWVLDVPAPGSAERQAIWAQEGARAGVALTDLEAELLATTYRLNGGRIAAAADRALLRAGGRSVLPQDLLEAARSLSTTDLGRLGQEIRPRFGWADIVLPAEVSEALHEIIDRVVHHGRVFGDWGFDARHAASRSLSVLFCGPSGTGKTMAAEVIATELGLPLYRVDLSAVVSKYIGETEKNLSQIFSDAASSGAILFFDEADALFGKRSEVHDSHDRYANLEVSYLLQRMEDYEGIVVLASNLRQNMDEAFVRRLHIAIDFPFPDAAAREEIWRRTIPGRTPLADDIDLATLAKRHRLSGGNIRNAVVTAAFLAAARGGPVAQQDFLAAIRREHQKMGKLLIGEEAQA